MRGLLPEACPLRTPALSDGTALLAFPQRWQHFTGGKRADLASTVFVGFWNVLHACTRVLFYPVAALFMQHFLTRQCGRPQGL